MFPLSRILWNVGRMVLMTVPEQALMDTVVNAAGEAENGDLRGTRTSMPRSRRYAG